MRNMILLAAIALFATAAVADETKAVLYPKGVPARVNALTGETEQPGFLLLGEASLPDSGRKVVVYSERFPGGGSFEKLHSVFAAVLAGNTVLDRRDLTADVPLSLDEPGHVFELDALVTSLPIANAIAVELWSSLHGTAGYNASNHLFFSVDAAGKLVPALTLKDTFGSAKEDLTTRGGTATAIRVGPAEMVVERRHVTWTASNTARPRAECGPAEASVYRFDGRTFQPASTTKATDSFRTLPTLLETPTCN